MVHIATTPPTPLGIAQVGLADLFATVTTMRRQPTMVPRPRAMATTFTHSGM
jgi:hypothetical protein